MNMNSENNNQKKQVATLIAIMGVLTAVLLCSVVTLVIAAIVI